MGSTGWIKHTNSKTKDLEKLDEPVLDLTDTLPKVHTWSLLLPKSWQHWGCERSKTGHRQTSLSGRHFETPCGHILCYPKSHTHTLIQAHMWIPFVRGSMLLIHNCSLSKLKVEDPRPVFHVVCKLGLTYALNMWSPTSWIPGDLELSSSRIWVLIMG